MSLGSTSPNKSLETIAKGRNHWMPDGHCKECFECGIKFTTFRRKHHCRFCGRIFCSNCSKHSLDGSKLGLTGPQRACGSCAVNHRMLLIKTNESFASPPETIRPSPDIVESDHSLFPPTLHINQSQNFAPASSFQTPHPRKSIERHSMSDLFLVTDDDVPTTRRLFNPPDVDNKPDSQLNIQLFFGLWFKMTCPTLQEPLLERDKPVDLPIFHRLSASLDSSHPQIMTPTAPLSTVVVGTFKCASGQNIVDWLIANCNGLLDSRERACQMCDAYVKASFLTPLHPTDSSTRFRDDQSFYVFREPDENPTSSRRAYSTINAPVPHSRPKLRLTSGLHRWSDASIPETEHQPESQDVESLGLSPFVKNPAAPDARLPQSQSESPSLSQQTSNELKNIYSRHVAALIRQETMDYHLPADEWNLALTTAVKMLCEDLEMDLRQPMLANIENRQAGNSTTPAKMNQQCYLIGNWNLQGFYASKYSAMSILRYVHIKKLVESEANSCQILNGIAFSGHVVHKHLPKLIYQPRIILIASSIAYETNVYKRTSLESYAAQEEEYLNHCVTKILSFCPTMIIIEGSVSNHAMRLFLKADVAVFSNIKRSVLARIASSTGIQIVRSTDALLSGSYDTAAKRPNSIVGTCQFYRIVTILQPDGSRKPLCILSFKDLSQMGNDVSQGPVSSAAWFKVLDRSPDPTSLSRSQHSRAFSADVEQKEQQALQTAFRMPAYCLLLKGRCLAQLKLAKRCLKLALLSGFNARLESAYLKDACLLPTREFARSQQDKTKTLFPCSHVSKDDGDGEKEAYHCHASTLGCHLSGRLFNLSPLPQVELPFLATVEGRHTPLFQFYCYLVNWRAEQRLNDLLKQKSLVVRAQVYAATKPPPAYLMSPCDPETGVGECAFIRHHRLAAASGRIDALDEAAYLAARSAAFGGSGGKDLVQRWTSLGSFIRNSIGKTTPKIQLTPPPKSKPPNKRLVRSIRDARSQLSTYVLRSVFSFDSVICPEPCLPPFIIGIEAYGDNDLPLGVLLERFCFRSQGCLNPECNTLMLNHVQRFTQTSGCVELRLQHLDAPPQPTQDVNLHGNQHPTTPIKMWTVCSVCRRGSPCHQMSLWAWQFSFMKFIDLLINSNDALIHENYGDGGGVGRLCCRARNLKHCFSLNKSLAIFAYMPIVTHEVYMPPISMWIFSPQSDPAVATTYERMFTSSTKPRRPNEPVHLEVPLKMPEHLRADAHATLNKYYELTTEVKSHLVNLKNDVVCDDLTRLIEALEDNIYLECTRTEVKSRVELLAFLFDSFAKSCSESPISSPTDGEIPTTPTPGQQLPEASENSVSTNSNRLDESPEMINISGDDQKGAFEDFPHNTQAPPAWKNRISKLSHEEKLTLLIFTMNLLKRWLFTFAQDWNLRISHYNSTVKMLEKTQIKQTRKQQTTLCLPLQQADQQSVLSFDEAATNGDGLMHLTPISSAPDLPLEVRIEIDGFSRSAKEPSDLELSTSEPAASSHATSSTPSVAAQSAAAGKSTIEAVKRIFSSILTAGGDTHDQKVCPEPWPPSEHPTIPPPNPRTPLCAGLALRPTSADVPSLGSRALGRAVSACERIAQMLAVEGGDNVGISILEELPDVYVNDQEITTMIAYALASESYSNQLQSILSRREVVENNAARSSARLSEYDEDEQTISSEALKTGCHENWMSVIDKGEGAPSCSLQTSNNEPPSSNTVDIPDDAKSAKFLPSESHLEIQFSDASTTFLCRVYYAEEFFRLRELLLPQGEVAFIRSLWRCRNWDARGGKSGSTFMKTHDERFVVKELSSSEMKTFHEINKQYFAYLMSVARVQRLCLLARILGIFHIDFKNAATSEARRMDVLVTENLFHNRPGITHIYDLKGSLRKRLITNAEGIAQENTSVDTPVRGSWDDPAHPNGSPVVPVLLDQNFINDSLENPIYLRLHSKNALIHCLNIDTLFLSELFIMDYSLLVGLDRVTGQLVVGIIDYLRKFTLNKRLEMIFKQTLTSAQGPMPTIIMPADYRERLIGQMERNFHLVPDQWYDSLADNWQPWRCPASASSSSH